MSLLGRYLSGLCVAALGLGVAGWLVLTPLAFGYRGAGLRVAALTDRATGTGLAVISVLTLTAWTLAWRRKLRADGILVSTSRWRARRQARELRRRERAGHSEPASGTSDPAQVLSELRALLLPLLTDLDPETPETPGARSAAPLELHHHGAIPRPRHEQYPLAVPGDFQADQPAASGPAAIDSTLAGAELLTAGVGEEEAW